MPLWALDAVGMIPPDGTKVRVIGATGWVDAYESTVGMEIQYGGKWFDMGAVDVLSPDTEWSPIARHAYSIPAGAHGVFRQVRDAHKRA